MIAVTYFSLMPIVVRVSKSLLKDYVSYALSKSINSIYVGRVCAIVFWMTCKTNLSSVHDLLERNFALLYLGRKLAPLVIGKMKFDVPKFILLLNLKKWFWFTFKISFSFLTNDLLARTGIGPILNVFLQRRGAFFL